VSVIHVCVYDHVYMMTYYSMVFKWELIYNSHPHHYID